MATGTAALDEYRRHAELYGPELAVETAATTPRPAPLRAQDVMTAAEVAEYLQIPVRSVHEYAARGELPSVRIGRHRRFSRAAVEAVVERG
jgi:excisionase family DNA binding protein